MPIAPNIVVPLDEERLKIVELAASANCVTPENFARIAILGAARRTLSEAKAASEGFLAEMVTPSMVRAGAAALFDGTELESYLSPTTAEMVAQNVLEAALRAGPTSLI